jgi:hypothetical protein
MEGLCLYPVLNHFGWDDDRPCQNGLLEQERVDGRRSVYQPLAAELLRAQRMHSGNLSATTPFVDHNMAAPVPSLAEI